MFIIQLALILTAPSSNHSLSIIVKREKKLAGPIQQRRMEGYMIRMPMEACFPDASSVWDHKSAVSQSAHARVLYYVLEEGYLRGYETPNDANEPVESFRLTSNRIEVNTMYSLNIFEIKARSVKLRLPQQSVEDTSTSDSSSIDNDGIKQANAATLYMPPATISSSLHVINETYHVVFFAANPDLVKKWSVELLNWNRFVFGSSADHDNTELRMAKKEILDALHVVNAANQFLRPVKILTALQTNTETADTPASTSEHDHIITASINLSTVAIDPSNLALTEKNNSTPVNDSIDVVKPSGLSTQHPKNPWWIASFGKHRKISSYSKCRLDKASANCK